MFLRLSQPPPGSTSRAVMEVLEEARHFLSQLEGRLKGAEEHRWRRERARRVTAVFMMSLIGQAETTDESEHRSSAFYELHGLTDESFMFKE